LHQTTKSFAALAKEFLEHCPFIHALNLGRWASQQLIPLRFPDGNTQRQMKGSQK
jgi:hypothetical protein